MRVVFMGSPEFARPILQALLAGARRFDGCVEGEQIGLLGDIVDGFDDGPDLRRVLLHLLHFAADVRDSGLDIIHGGHCLLHSPGA
jgi:hypothetical protein